MLAWGETYSNPGCKIIHFIHLYNIPELLLSTLQEIKNTH